MEMGQISSEWQVHSMPPFIFAALQARFQTDGKLITVYWWFLVEGPAEQREGLGIRTPLSKLNLCILSSTTHSRYINSKDKVLRCLSLVVNQENVIDY